MSISASTIVIDCQIEFYVSRAVCCWSLFMEVTLFMMGYHYNHSAGRWDRTKSMQSYRCYSLLLFLKEGDIDLSMRGDLEARSSR